MTDRNRDPAEAPGLPADAAPRPNLAQLRRRAEEEARSLEPQEQEALSPDETRQVLHELRVHQIELELQNEELRQTQARLDAARARYLDLYDLAPVGYCALSKKGVILEANLTAATLLGVARGALVMQPITRFILPEDQDIYYRHQKQLLDTGAPRVCELRMLREYRAPFWARLDATAAQDSATSSAQDAAGAPSCRVAMSDISERKRAEEALRQSEERLQRAANAGNVGLWDWDLRTQQVFYSPQWKRQIGYEDREIEARYEEWESRIHPADLRATLAALKASCAPPWPPYSVEFRLRHKDGSHRWILAVGALEFDEEKQPVRMMGSHVDITDRKRAEEERAKLESQLQQAQKMESVGRLAGGVAHDFNNMLGVILGRAEMVLDQVDPAQPIHSDLEEIRKAAERSANLTRQLLAFARKQTIAPRVLDLNKTIESMLEMLRRLIGEDIDLTWLPGAGIWPVKVDPSQIDQILANLCANARDAVAGVGRIVIETENVAVAEAYYAEHAGPVSGEFVLLTVSDTGRGMDKETLTHIFEPFFTTKGVGEGTGLGLATIYGIVKQNNGLINVYSEPGQGTIFKIYLPRHAGKAAQMQEEGPG